MISCFASQASQLIYDNTSTRIADARFKINNGIELGDEVLLDWSKADPVGTKLDGFRFQYYGLNFNGTEQVQVRFYGINQTTYTPSTLLWDSGLVSLPGAPDSATMQFNDFGNVTLLPEDIMWTVQFSGLTGTAEAGLEIFTPPTVGNNFTTYWQKVGGSWQMLRAMDDGQSEITIDFGAQFTAVPEPSTMALGLLGLAGLAGAAIRRRIARR